MIPFMFEMPSLVELLGIGFMTSFDLPVRLRAAWRYVFVRDAQVRKMPGELWSERRAVIGLDLLNGKGKMFPDFLEKVDGGLGVVVVVDSQHPKSGRFVNGLGKNADALYPRGERTLHRVERSGPEPAEVHRAVLGQDDTSFVK